MSNPEASESHIKLRGHHLICLHFFHGEGYNAEYVENLSHVLKMAAYKEIEICNGIDDVCKKCPYVKDEKCYYNEHADEEIKEMDEKARRLLNLTTGMKIKWYKIKKELSGIFNEWSESYCKDCNWRQVCEKDVFYKQLKTVTPIIT
jgi:hypothetical protein